MTEARQNLSQQVKGRRGRSIDKAWAHRMPLVRAGETLTDTAAHRLEAVFDADDATGKVQAVWKVKEQLRILLRTISLVKAAAAKDELRSSLRPQDGPRRTSSTARSAAGGRRLR